MSAPTTTTCPPWCAADHRDDPKWIARVHYRRIGTLGIEVWAEQNPDGSLGPAHVTVGDLIDAMHTEELTVEQARQFGADLTAAASLIEGDRGIIDNRVWQHGYRTGREHALKGWPSLLDDDWETGEPLTPAAALTQRDEATA